MMNKKTSKIMGALLAIGLFTASMPAKAQDDSWKSGLFRVGKYYFGFQACRTLVSTALYAHNNFTSEYSSYYDKCNFIKSVAFLLTGIALARVCFKEEAKEKKRQKDKEKD